MTRPLDLVDDHGTQFNPRGLSLELFFRTAFSNILRILHRYTSHPTSLSSPMGKPHSIKEE
jgi:hypothetical protein